MADVTAAEMLTAVNTAILELIQGKAKAITAHDGRSFTYNDLTELRAMRTELQKEVRSGSSMVRLGDISGC
jgi:hypothetical protein